MLGTPLYLLIVSQLLSYITVVVWCIFMLLFLFREYLHDYIFMYFTHIICTPRENYNDVRAIVAYYVKVK